jgi:hypothetical protein
MLEKRERGREGRSMSFDRGELKDARGELWSPHSEVHRAQSDRTAESRPPLPFSPIRDHLRTASTIEALLSPRQVCVV